MTSETELKHARAGRWVRAHHGPEPFSAFIPAPLPPNPPIRFDESLQDLDEKANRALGRLDGMCNLLAEPNLLLYGYIRKEAVLSSQIEGTQSSLSDLLLFETKEVPGVPIADVKEVSNYVGAMQHGLKRLKGGFPLSIRLMKDIHRLLLKNARGGDKEPGELRRSQNWVGGTRPGNATYVPPPAHEVLPALGELEKFLHGQPGPTPTLLKAGLAHAQFESIHPFLDGNGRLGRLLVTFVLCAEDALSEPLLYLSLYFKEHRKEYYTTLQRVRTDGDWEGWLSFFLRGVQDVALQAAETAGKLISTVERDRRRVQKIGKAAGTALRIHDFLKRNVFISAVHASEALKISFPAVSHALSNLERMGILKEFTGRRRDRVFRYEPYYKILAVGTQPIPVTE